MGFVPLLRAVGTRLPLRSVERGGFTLFSGSRGHLPLRGMANVPVLGGSKPPPPTMVKASFVIFRADMESAPTGTNLSFEINIDNNLF